MKVIIFPSTPKCKRIKFYIPIELTEIRAKIKLLNTSWYHPTQKKWSIINTKEIKKKLLDIIGNQWKLATLKSKEKVINGKVELREESLKALDEINQKLIIKRYAHSTLKTYKSFFYKFLCYFNSRNLTEVRKEEIEAFLYKMVVKERLSETAQNQFINAIKFYYEHVLKQPREYYDIQRPKKSNSLPNVLCKEDVKKVLQIPSNIKHKAILSIMYSGGLRIGEVPNLRIEDIRSKEGYIFVKGGKGKKDRRVPLSPKLLDLLRKYYKAEKPSYWLFEGQTGGQYSKSSINNIFRKAAKAARINPWATPHTLRHSLSTHLLQQGVSLRYIQAILGHNSSKTTEIYTHILHINNKEVENPLDTMF